MKSIPTLPHSSVTLDFPRVFDWQLLDAQILQTVVSSAAVQQGQSDCWMKFLRGIYSTCNIQTFKLKASREFEVDVMPWFISIYVRHGGKIMLPFLCSLLACELAGLARGHFKTVELRNL